MPVDPNNVHADVPHQKTIIGADWRYSCKDHEMRKGAAWVQDGWIDLSEVAGGPVVGRMPRMTEIEINFLDIPCGHDKAAREKDPYCAGCKHI